ncbi:CCR4-Not complex 3'-5'-exoribonuclease subunit Ccr4 (Carbon catabolite repressor protein 4) (Cytoplasmic deadenylase) (Glucose-repressible alcohol dehydrogenase transcriptional effector) [Durusdinium trenchii]|uniref:CCR4-Not complex 3'-5'-exoribonuclease subunit Ccr4 (Carbon catabolite repressor protein 4) (Cytoplasmic deadenylase) (Glucose-repressible alcohol dehydrogenase transcriptional effector) n=1 Tax=Durusdinium trenchii TaxID=1381693 RepID=A0ABP0KLL4_9DINO
MSYNVLLPNSQDGWWIYKYYRDSRGSHTDWTERQALLRQQILDVGPEVLCLQEVCELSFQEDFGFLREAGYEILMHEKKGRMRPATCWRPHWQKITAQHKDRSLVVGLQRPGAGLEPTTMFIVNVHLSAGPNADRRLRQVHEALDCVEKEIKKLKMNPAHVPIVFCGDFNSQGATAVRELLTTGEVHPEFRESGDPTEIGQEGKQITSKVKKHGLALFQDAAESGYGRPPATILAQNIADKMLTSDGTLTPEMQQKLDAAFDSCRADHDVLSSDDVERFLLKVNRALGRGSEFRFVQKVYEETGRNELCREDFHALYAAELADGKFWGVEHDMRELVGSGLAKPADGPYELRFDYIYFTGATLKLTGVDQVLSQVQFDHIFGEPYEILPNSWHPSDHLPVIASFGLNGMA